MGTRGSFAVKHGSRFVQQYMHSGTEPNTAGAELVGLLKSSFDLAAFKRVFADWTVVDDDVPTRGAALSLAVEQLGLSEEEAEVWRAKNAEDGEGWYNLLRDAQGDFDSYLSGALTVFLDHGDVLGNSDTEWGYLLDLDAEVLVLYANAEDILKNKGLRAVKASPHVELVTHAWYDKPRWEGCAEITRIPFADIKELPIEATHRLMDRIYRIY